MNKEIRQTWTTALRSGEYNQGRSRLRKGDNYCCLGVLADIYAKQTGKAYWQKDTENDNYPTLIVEDMGYIVSLPDSIRGWAEISKDEELYCMKLNDGEKLCFARIADKIETTIE